MNDMAFDTEAAFTLSARQAESLQAVSEQLGRLNATVREAVHAGLSVELIRASRHHCGQGFWGDQMKPNVVKCG